VVHLSLQSNPLLSLKRHSDALPKEGEGGGEQEKGDQQRAERERERERDSLDDNHSVELVERGFQETMRDRIHNPELHVFLRHLQRSGDSVIGQRVAGGSEVAED
jgi:hypothetical protein